MKSYFAPAALVCLLATFLSGCGHKPTVAQAHADETRKPKPETDPADALPFRKPTATEAFNLRTKCVELSEKINSEYDKTTNNMLAAAHEPLLPLVQEHHSHYNPRTNRCYVELRVVLNTFLLMAPKELDMVVPRAEFWKNYTIEYVNRTLYDGQTEEELASLLMGMVGHEPIALIGNDKVDWKDAFSKIDETMAEEDAPATTASSTAP
jgi:hypothetical protein